MLDIHERPLMLIRPRVIDKKTLEEGLGLFNGFHINASIPQFMTNFIRNMGKPFILDPMVYIFTIRPKQLLDKEKGTLRPSVHDLAGRYGALYQANAGKRAIAPKDIAAEAGGIESITRNVLEYQRNKFTGQMEFFNPYYDKYALWGDKDTLPTNILSLVPEVFVPPYFLFKNTSDAWYRLTIECAKYSLALKESNEYIFPTLLFDPEILGSQDSIKRILEELAPQKFDGFFLWANGFKEEDEKTDRLQGLLQLVQGLSAGRRPVFKLFGGYFSALLFAYGLKGFTCGLGYGSDKNIYKFGTGGGKKGMPFSKFYVPRLHRSIELGDAERLLRSYPDLRCSCRICNEVYGKNIDKFTEMQKLGRCESHFLNVRRSELKEIGANGVEKILPELKRTINEFNQNPLVKIESLKRWCEVLES